jgi:hypothetical protein
MPLSRDQRTNIWTIFRLIGERDMPSNCTAERLVERSNLNPEEVMWAIEILWADDAGFIRVDVHPRSGERGYFVDPKSKKKTPMDLDTLYANWEISQEDGDEDGDEDDDEDDD